MGKDASAARWISRPTQKNLQRLFFSVDKKSRFALGGNMTRKLLAFLIVTTLTSCDNGLSSAQKSATETQVSGQVIRDNKPILQADIEATDLNGHPIGKTHLDGKDHFSLRLPSGTIYPVILTATPEGEASTLKAVVLNDKVSTQEISTMTTILLDQAMVLGGITEENLSKASQGAISQRKTPPVSDGKKVDPQKKYGGWH
ncbi:MAG: hypothetical protein EBT06_10230 [Gammaproteobacteria bacterium]|jgi:hypothetical protein|nr:hypothetical protein [Gammaproteobacteria bacterium]NBT45278.1 hypothetical protein [Gammaproteobacteria bacterium]NDE34972.1 hypothetical protein [Gammaproteobacteria bacterium]NDE57022.1 hypothetical protein [Gammaproteobacteria bacterium]NDG88257.1 hypothetical protein [Gammaproteobacteria bacterium]